MKQTVLCAFVFLLHSFAIAQVKDLTIDCSSKKLLLDGKNVTSLNENDEIKIRIGKNCSPGSTISYEVDGEKEGNYDNTNTIKLKNKKSIKFGVKPPDGNEISLDPVEIKGGERRKNSLSKTSRYDRKNNEANFVFDQDGQLIGRQPVNIDADDKIKITIRCLMSSAAEYRVEVEGEYGPLDLNIRPSSTDEAGGQSKSEDEDAYVEWVKEFGPFTSEEITLKIYKSGTEIVTQRIRINPLYHVAVGGSFVATKVPKNEFDIFPLGNTNEYTIDSIITDVRPIATFNVIFYWKPTVDWITGKLKGKSHITTGRDILKEPTFWERLNPTFGVSIDKGWRENFFAGGIFEFARGGSISAGWHYGRVQRLADKNFELGVTPFSGSKSDIKLAEYWQWGTYFGITLDTRIFNSIFNRN
ncbi:MAG: hypothetical protein JNN28_08485 [Saprospiraceae bacterium]|nr:hypothetical protein [Saprospiraceae bacterium]